MVKFTSVTGSPLSFFQFINNIDVYNLMVFNLIVLSLIGVYTFTANSTLTQLLIAVITASVLDLLINYFKYKKFSVPKTGIISGLFVGTVLDLGQLWYIPLIAATIAIISKHIIMIKGKNILNPASFGMVLTGLIFGTSLGWWSATFLPWILIVGLLVLYKIRGYQTFTFLLTYYVLFIILPAMSTGISGIQLSGFYNPQLLFFSFFMLTEPKTAPFRRNSKFIYGFLVALFNYLLIQYFSNYAAYAFVLPLLIANLLVPIINQKIK